MRRGSIPRPRRSEEAMELKPDVIASGCPFCMTMLDNGVKDIEAQDRVVTKDIAELVVMAMPKLSSAPESEPEPETESAATASENDSDPPPDATAPTGNESTDGSESAAAGDSKSGERT